MYLPIFVKCHNLASYQMEFIHHDNHHLDPKMLMKNPAIDVIKGILQQALNLYNYISTTNNNFEPTASNNLNILHSKLQHKIGLEKRYRHNAIMYNKIIQGSGTKIVNLTKENTLKNSKREKHC